MLMKFKRGMPDGDDNPFVLSIGDLMAALLLIFVLLLSATLLELQKEFAIKKASAEEAQKLALTREELAKKAQISAEKIQELATTYKKLRKDLYNDLYAEFKNDLDRWSATIDEETLSIRFKEPSVFFDSGKSTLKLQFKDILRDFFPRYVQLLYQEKYQENIEEIRIEGHTSSEWFLDNGAKDAYFLNMQLSQDRTRSVLEFGLSEMPAGEKKVWARSKITANGLSSSKRILRNDASEDKEASRRVEFRVRTDAEKRIGDILGATTGS
jgi:outer membrane protein OmpA-like peptidoglycan-associated protein